mmetsp:Transcript_51160/g.81805  ORF Transcript_51160/g.81805 Transcript_51160/m.81805 type:complete len:256 (+) Transcript_51160:1083-1850(+)
MIAMEVVVKLLQLSCRDGPGGPAAATSRIWILLLQPLDEVCDVLLQTRPCQTPVAEAVHHHGDQATNGYMKATGAGLELHGTGVQVRQQSCIASNGKQGPNDEWQAKHPHAQHGMLVLHLNMSSGRVMVVAHRCAVQVQQEQLVMRQALHLEVKALRVQSRVTRATEVDGGALSPEEVVVPMRLHLDTLQIFAFFRKTRRSSPQLTARLCGSFFLSLLTWQVGSQGDISDDDRQAKDHRGKVEGQCPTNNSQQHW